MTTVIWLKNGEQVPGMEWTKAMHGAAVAVQNMAQEADGCVTMKVGTYVLAALPGDDSPTWEYAMEGTSDSPEAES